MKRKSSLLKCIKTLLLAICALVFSMAWAEENSVMIRAKVSTNVRTDYLDGALALIDGNFAHMVPALNNDKDYMHGPAGDGTLQHVISFPEAITIKETYIQAWTGSD